MKCHNSPLSTIYYCTVARTIDKSINTLCSFASIWKGKCAFFTILIKKAKCAGKFSVFQNNFHF